MPVEVQPEHTVPAEPKDSGVPAGSVNEPVSEGSVVSNSTAGDSDSNEEAATETVPVEVDAECEMERACRQRFQMTSSQMTPW